MSGLHVERSAVRALAEAGLLDEAARRRAEQVLGLRPAPEDWARLLVRCLTGAGASLLACGLIFFFAFNWDELMRWQKFALAQSAFAAAAGAAWWMGADRFGGRAALFAGMLLLGALLALFGQTYQTGADPWELFRTWALLGLPWVVVARSAPVTGLWLLLVNVAVVLWPLLLNAMAALAAQRLAPRLRDAAPLLTVQAAAFASLVAAGWTVVGLLGAGWSLWLVLPASVLLVLTIWFDLLFPDGAAAACCYLAAVVCASGVAAKLFFPDGREFAVSYLGVAAVALGCTVGAVIRVRNVAQRSAGRPVSGEARR
jgi:uncharacterized membrane protein